ncbi:MAG: secretin N-terminal domain-containing protein [Gammaproteobacteria bacterium]
MKRSLLPLSTLMLLALSGCITTPPHSSPASLLSQAASIHPQPPHRALPPPQALRASFLPPIRHAPSHLSPEHFNLAVHNVPARAFFLGLVKGTSYNIVVAPKVRGRVTLTLKRVTIPEVLAILEATYGYHYQRIPGGYLVLPKGLLTRVFQVNYLDVSRKGVTRTMVTSGETTNVPENNGYGGGMYGGMYGGEGGIGMTGYSGAQGGMSQQLYLPSGQEASTSVETKFKADFWKHILKALDSIVGTTGGRKIIVSPASGVVVVRATPEDIRMAARYLKTVQGSLDREVVIEAKILEVTLNKGFQTGINWAALGQPGTGKTILAGQIGGQNLFNQGVSTLAGQPIALQPNNPTPISSFPTTAFGGTFATALNLGDFSGFIELLQTQGQVHVLSSPRVATLNNQQAVIKVGTDQYFVTGVNSNTVALTAVSTASNVILTPFFSGISLDVTPQITSHGAVILQIHPTVSKVTTQITSYTVSGQSSTLPLALSQVRESDTVVRAHSGQVIVIGGLMKNEIENQVYETPVLGHIPFLGNLFKQRLQKTVKTELVILLRPIVVGTRRAWSRYARHEAHYFRGYGHLLHSRGH